MSPRKTTATAPDASEATPDAAPDLAAAPDETAPADAAGSPGPLAEPAADELADVAGLGYEEARDELARIVAGLEGGQVPLEESMRLWRRGEALAAHCTAWLDGAQRQVEAATAPRD